MGGVSEGGGVGRRHRKVEVVGKVKRNRFFAHVARFV